MKDDIFEHPQHTCRMEKAVGVYRCLGNPPFVCVVERDKASYSLRLATVKRGTSPTSTRCRGKLNTGPSKKGKVDATALAERIRAPAAFAFTPGAMSLLGPLCRYFVRSILWELCLDPRTQWLTRTSASSA
ncbi:hypothetical protein X729_27925 [Mesorhizobium sp. L103C131B0]|nr:hypothetical protein X729_27925 [Mesorhizobium sp. L103C131B0]